MRALSCLLLLLAGACAAQLAEPAPATPTPAEPPPPVPAPLPGGSGCVGLPELRVGQTYEHNGQRYGVVAQLATTVAPRVPLVQRGNTQHPLDERPRAHPVPLLVCGGPACPSPTAVSLPPRRFVAVPFASSWQLGSALPLSYDFWWAQVSYDRARDCPARAPR